jgi:hypothetical protein
MYIENIRMKFRETGWEVNGVNQSVSQSVMSGVDGKKILEWILGKQGRKV